MSKLNKAIERGLERLNRFDTTGLGPPVKIIKQQIFESFEAMKETEERFDNNKSLENRCPKCGRFGVERNSAGKFQCLWRECLWIEGDSEEKEEEYDSREVYKGIQRGLEALTKAIQDNPRLKDCVDMDKFEQAKKETKQESPCSDCEYEGTLGIMCHTCQTIFFRPVPDTARRKGTNWIKKESEEHEKEHFIHNLIIGLDLASGKDEWACVGRMKLPDGTFRIVKLELKATNLTNP